ncbi:MAG: S41 family peptidase [Treponema sp.]|nr:S41 family peptidase [Treponema sp.]
MKHFKIFFYFYCIGILVLLPACRPEIDDSYPELDVFIYDFPQIFEVFWHGMNRNYLYWDIEPASPYWDSTLSKLTSGERSSITSDPMVFWDIIHDHYKLKFEALGVFNNKDSPGYADAANTAHEYFKDMTRGLRDGNFRIVFEDKEDINPGRDRRFNNLKTESTPGASGVFSFSDLTEAIVNLGEVPGDSESLDVYMESETAYFKKYNYVDNVICRYLDIAEKKLDLPEFKIVRGVIQLDDGIIIYLHYNHGSIFEMTESNSDIKAIYDEFLLDLEKPEVMGVIMDMRGNTGSSLMDTGFFWGRIVDELFTYSETRAKSGEARLDYGPWIPNRIIPAPEGEKKLANKDAKIIFLADRGTSSAAEFMIMAAKAYENGHVTGTNTMGAAGSAALSGNNIAYNGGGFIMDHFIEYVSGAEVQNRGVTDKQIYEGIGIEPDNEITMTNADWLNFYGQSGADPIDKWLQAAIDIINLSHNASENIQ